MTHLTRLVGLTPLVSPESTRLPTVVPARLRHVLTSSTVGVASRRQLSFTGGKLIKFKTSVPTPLAFHTSAPEPEDDFVPNPAVNSFRNGAGRRRRKELPEELMKNVVKLTCASTAPGGVCDVYVVGTIHESEESIKKVRDIIRFLKPKVVFMELCLSRRNLLLPRHPCEKIEMPTFVDLINMLKETGDPIGTFLYWFSKFDVKHKVGPYSEFSAAAEELSKYGGRATLGDRPIGITKLRAWRKMSLWQQTQYFFAEVYFILRGKISTRYHRTPEDEEKMDPDFEFFFPFLKETIVDERDQCMTTALHEVASKHTIVVAVVGRGHLSGIKKNWKNPLSRSEIEEFLEVPPKNPNEKILAYVIIAFVGAAIISGIYGIYLLCKYIYDIGEAALEQSL